MFGTCLSERQRSGQGVGRCIAVPDLHLWPACACILTRRTERVTHAAATWRVRPAAQVRGSDVSVYLGAGTGVGLLSCVIQAYVPGMQGWQELVEGMWPPLLPQCAAWVCDAHIRALQWCSWQVNLKAGGSQACTASP